MPLEADESGSRRVDKLWDEEMARNIRTGLARENQLAARVGRGLFPLHFFDVQWHAFALNIPAEELAEFRPEISLPRLQRLASVG